MTKYRVIADSMLMYKPLMENDPLMRRRKIRYTYGDEIELTDEQAERYLVETPGVSRSIALEPVDKNEEDSEDSRSVEEQAEDRNKEAAEETKRAQEAKEESRKQSTSSRR